MCTTSACDLEEIPLDDNDPDSMEFKILEFYVRHHVLKNTSDVLSPKLLRTRSLSQKGPESWLANETWIQRPQPCRNSQSNEKTIKFVKKKPSWRTLFGVAEKEEDSQSSPPEFRLEGKRRKGPQSGPHSPQWPRSLSNVEQRLEREDGEDQIIARIVELLKYSGDQLERELKRDKTLMNIFQDGLSYPVFKTITDQFLRGVDTRGESEVNAQGFKAALAIDAMAKLTAIDNHPMNRMLGFGTKYLKENFSPWVQQHGGWEKVLGIPHEETD
ncbi:apoptosis facilitator Bcl-2-like protein 14 isoform X3 [Hippopotamus amphibius kiboko]|uniref:apoptosis facilitator Bcl-2-like protein 14 isoform X3 n=1 Tax=Hippopotamus amphibius kiboko TaxID=575201 RepID=UPI00259A7B32|nr:apoptosis facilitator Bcl-2-like protein 14 isoform X3 [Hippopotamus amphibius kiboko]